jgi:peptidoglycan hydrolase-like protein with peptidoglycan-binding domain
MPTLIALVAVTALVATTAPASAGTAPASIPELAQGAGMGAAPSPAVRRVQRVLDRRGYDLGAPGVDGRFGPLTDAAVRRLQADSGLAVDGVVGPHTRRALGLAPRGAHPHRRTPSATPEQAKPAPEAPAPAAAPKPKPTPTPTARTTARPDEGPNSLWLIVLGAMAALLASMLARVVRRARAAAPAAGGPRTPQATPPAAADPPATTLAPIEEEVYLEGHSEQAGDFHGRAVASTVNHGEDRPEEPQTRYLVDDPGKAQPIWVGRSEIRRLITRARPSRSGSSKGRFGGRRRA